MATIKDVSGEMVDLDAEERRADELLTALQDTVAERLPIHGGTVFSAALNLLCKIICSYDDPNLAAQKAAELLVRTVAINTARKRQ